jgi:hypothetical protein
LRHEYLRAFQAQLALPQGHIPPYRQLRDRDVRVLVAQPRPDAMCCVPLLARRCAITLQHPLDRLLQQIQLRLPPLRFLPLRRQCTGDSLPHHAPVHLMLFRQLPDRFPGCISLPDLLE